MYKKSEIKKQYYRAGEAAKLLGVTTRTLRNYEYRGILTPERSEGGQRIYSRYELVRYMETMDMLIPEAERKDVLYARVSSHDQKTHGDLDRQVLFLLENVSSLKNPIVLKEVGSGLNDKRPKLTELILMVSRDEVRNIYITYKDRLTRFGFNYLKTMFEAHGTNIIVVKDEKDIKTVEEELVEDMMSLIASFSGKLYGMRSRQRGTK